MYAYNNNRESLKGCSTGQLWLYQLMRRMYQKSGPDVIIPVAEVTAHMEYGAAASRKDDQAFWREAVNDVGDLQLGWYERELAVDQHFAQLGLVTIRAADEPRPDANN